MGNEAIRCGFDHTLTEKHRSFGMETAQGQEDALDTCSSDVMVNDPLRKFVKQVPQKIKRLADIPLHCRSLSDLQDAVVNRVLQKSTKTMRSITAKQINSQMGEQVENSPDILLIIEEQIEKLTRERMQNGERNVGDTIDRGLLFKRLNINLANFIRTTGDNVKHYYDFKECIGEGSYGKVFRAICKRTSEQRAIKILKRREGGISRQKSFSLAEFDLLSTLDHPNIVKLYQIFYYKGHYYVVMQYCKGGSLIDLVKKNKHFSEQILSHIMKQLLSALAYLHNKNIVHRDIKLDNIVLVDTEDSTGFHSIKIIDFGTAVKLSTFRAKGRIAGTRSYMAPEVFKGVLNVKSDVWASGVFLYLLFLGKFPFVGRSLLQMEQVVNNHVVTFASSEWGFVSKQAKKLLMGMLQRSVEKRLSAAEALGQPWFQKTYHSEDKITYNQSNLVMLEKYQRGNNFVAVIENFLSLRQISQLERDRLGKLFRQIDKNNDGVIEETQLMQICQEHYGVDTQCEVRKILKEIDHNNSGKIDFNQFLVAMEGRNKLFLQSSLIEAFNFCDLDKDGYLQRGELLSLLAGCEREQVQYILSELDTDGDDKVSLSQFLAYFPACDPSSNTGSSNKQKTKA